MKHKLWLILLVFMSALCLTFSLSACGLFGLTEPEGPGGEQGGTEQGGTNPGGTNPGGEQGGTNPGTNPGGEQGGEQGGIEQPVDPETFVSEQITAEEWEATFADENFVNYKAEWSICRSGKLSTGTTSGNGTVTGTVIVMREDDKTYLKEDASIAFENGTQETQIAEMYTEREQNSDGAIYLYIKEEGVWEKLEAGGMFGDSLYNGVDFIFSSIGLDSYGIRSPFANENAEYSEEKNGYIYEAEWEGGHGSYVLKFKNGKLSAILATSSYTYDDSNTTAECSVTYGGQEISLPKIEGNLKFQLSEDRKNYSVVGIGTWQDTNLTIPAEFNGLPVTSIGEYAFAGCSGLTSIEIPDSVTSIGSHAFGRCSGLTGELNIPDSVTSIGSSAFEYCDNLTSITIPGSVTVIGENAFAYCYGLTGVYITDLSAWCKIDFKSNPLSYAQHLYLNGDEVKNLTIPSDIKEIKAYTFSGCSGLTSIEIPDSVTSIGKYAFYLCSRLTGELKIPNSVTSIGSWAFSGCSGLTSVTIGSGVTSIEELAFGGCSGLKNITVAAENTNYHSEGNCVIETATHTLIFGCQASDIPDNVTSIGDSAFYGCSELTSIEIPVSVTSIGDSAFYRCSGLTSIEIPVSVTLIGDSAFYRCSGLTSIEIPDSVTSIGKYAFYLCSGLTSIEIPDSVTSIGEYAFYKCSGLKNATIGSGVTSIGRGVFSNCNGLQRVIWNAENCINALSFQCDNISSVTFGENVKIIPAAFSGCSRLTSIEIPDSVTEIGGSAFAGCRGLKNVAIPNSVTSIGDRAFQYCSGLTSVTIGSGVTSIGRGAFYNCSELKTVYYKGSAEEWGNISIDNTYNSYLLNATRYYFTEDAPTAEEWESYDYWWHYDPATSLPTPWVKDQ